MVSAEIKGTFFQVSGAGAQAKTTAKSKDTDFSELMSSSQSKMSDNTKNVKSAGDKKAEEIKNFFEKNTQAVQKEATKFLQNEAEDAVENMSTMLVQVVQVVSEALNVSAEEITSAMEELNMNAEDLLTKNGLAELMTALTDVNSVMELMTDDSASELLQSMFSEISDLTEGFLQESGMTMDELTQMIEEQGKVLLLNATSSEVKGESKDELVQSKENDNQDVALAQNDAPVAETQTSKTSENSADSKQNKDSDESGHAEEFMAHLSQSLEKTEAFAQLNEMGEVSTPQRILSQVVTGIRSAVQNDLSTLEMQLNPESLGKINLTLMSRNGAVTAQIVAQNETTKEAIESQITELKENLQEQGVKIEAIEVTVSSRAFEENLDKHGESKEEQKSKKRISKAELDAILNPEQEEDSIEEEMMLQDGNTVSIRA